MSLSVIFIYLSFSIKWTKFLICGGLIAPKSCVKNFVMAFTSLWGALSVQDMMIHIGMPVLEVLDRP